MKTTISTVLAIIIAIVSLAVSPSANAVTNSSSNNLDVMMTYLEKYEVPYFGASPEEFDLTGDGFLDSFDLVLLRQKLINGDTGVNHSTLTKLEYRLLGIFKNLDIKRYKFDDFDTVTQINTWVFEYLRDFYYYINAEGELLDDGTPAITLNFLETEWELDIQGIQFTNFSDELTESDEIISQYPGFWITERDSKYFLVFKDKILNTNADESEDIGKAYALYYLNDSNAEAIIPELIQNINSKHPSASVTLDESESFGEITFEFDTMTLKIIAPILEENDKFVEPSAFILYPTFALARAKSDGSFKIAII